MAHKKMYRAGSIIESFDELEEIFKVSKYVMLDCGTKDVPKWIPKHSGFIISMHYYLVRNRIRDKKFAVAIKN